MTFKPMSFEDIVTPVWPIDTMPELSQTLGKARVDKIRFNGLGEASGASKRTRITKNPHHEYMQDIPAHSGGAIDDIIAGISSLEYGSSLQLSASRLHNLLQTLTHVSSDILMAGMRVDRRQAQRYLLAFKLCIQHISNHRRKTNDGACRI